MSKHYHTFVVTFAGLLAVGLTVSISPQVNSSAQGVSIGVSSAFAEGDRHFGSDGYDEEGYDHEERDRDGYDREGYSRDGHRRDRSYHKDHDRKKVEKTTTTGSEQPFVVKPTINQY